MLEIELKSKELKEYIYLELNKNKAEPIYDEDVAKITDLQLNTLDLIGEPTDVTIFDLIFFKNLKVCTLINMNISDKEIDILNKLDKLQFLQLDNCTFSNNKKLQLNLSDLVITNCENVKISIYEDMKSLESLHIVNCEDVDITGISKLNNLSKLFFQNLKLDEIDEVQEIKSLKYLNLNGSEIKNLEKISNITGLEIEHNDINALYDEEF